MPGHVKLRDMMIAGTHDANTNKLDSGIKFPFSQTQTLNVFEQLSLGIRYLDIRYCMNRASFLKKNKINEQSYDSLTKDFKNQESKLIPYSKVKIYEIINLFLNRLF